MSNRASRLAQAVRSAPRSILEFEKHQRGSISVAERLSYVAESLRDSVLWLEPALISRLKAKHTKTLPINVSP